MNQGLIRNEKGMPLPRDVYLSYQEAKEAKQALHRLFRQAGTLVRV